MPLSQKIVSAASKAGATLSRYRGRPFAELAERCVGSAHQALNNVNFDMTANGELRVLKIIADQNPGRLFDVGANEGEWTLLASKLCPAAQIHAFEVVPSTHASFVAATGHLPNVIANRFGLSDSDGEITIYMTAGTADATACPIEGLAMHAKLYQDSVQCEVRTGARYLAERNISQVDYLKIDVEGMDLRVIKGFGDDIRKVRALQFEYGIFNIGSHDLLADFCAWLTSRGFKVGKVFPRSVQFFDYGFEMENFQGSNFVAVRTDESRLFDALS